MAALDFPASPSTNDIHTENGASWKWTGTAWTRLGDVGAQGAQGAAGTAGAQGAQGVQGAAGSAGSAGAQGHQGVQGATGSGTATADKIFEGNTKAEVVDTGSDGKFFVETEGTERFSIDSTGDFTFNNCNDSVFNAGGNLTFDYKMSNSLKFRWMLQTNDLKLYPMADNYPINIWNSDASKQIKIYRTGEADVGYGISLSGSTGNINATGIVTASSFSGSGADLTGITAGYWGQDSVGLNTVTSVGVNTSTVNDKDLQGIGNTFNGMYIANGMMIYDNALSGNHYIGTAFNGLMAGPVTIHGTLSVDGQYVVV